MKLSFVLCIVATIAFSNFSSAQTFDFQLVGNPVDTAGWNMSNQSHIDSNQITLTNPIGSQAGYIYYRQPENLGNCSQFTVTFQFRITDQSSPPADGIAFWYITNPPSNFVSGGGIGLPNNPNGLVLILDTYNNNGLPNDNPLVSLRRFDGTSNYIEGSSTGRLCPDLTYQSFITDGNWHTCTLKYFFGTVTVSFDGNPPVMSGTTTLNMVGYFGLSASTGALWSKHSIKDVHISGAPTPSAPQTDSIWYCQYSPASPVTATPDSGATLIWYTNAIGGNPLSTAPTPITTTPGTFIWYVSEMDSVCNLESVRVPVVVTVKPLPEFDRNISMCAGDVYHFYGRQLMAPGTYTAIRPAPTGQCDSLIKLNLTIKSYPETNLIPSDNISFCQGNTGIIQVNSPTIGASYQWLHNGVLIPGATGPSYIASEAGAYQVVGNLSGCIDSSNAIIATLNPLPIAKILTTPPDDICSMDTITLEAQSGTGYNYIWTPAKVFRYTLGAESQTVEGVFKAQTTKVILTVFNQYNCTDSDSIIVYTKPCCEIFAPNAFSPNGDGINDYFKLSLQAGQHVLSFSVYDRYGSLVYQDKTDKISWNGNYPNGKPAPTAVYKYYLLYTCTDGTTLAKRGDITLLR